MTIFSIFQYYHVASNGHISALFCKYGLKFFFGTSKHVILAKEEKNWSALTFEYCFKVNKLKNMIFSERFLVYGAKFPYEAILGWLQNFA